MKKTWKRLGAVLLAAFMMLSTTVCALANETPTTTPALNETINLTVSNVNDGDTVYAYRLVSYNDSGNGYTFFDGDNNNGFESYIKNVKGQNDAQAYLSKLDAAGVNKLLDGYATECNKVDAEYKLPTDPISAKAVNSQATLILHPGYYLLLTKTNSTNNRIYTPMAAFVKVDGEKLLVYAGSNGNALTAETDQSYRVSAKSADGPTIDKKTNATKSSDSSTANWKATAAAGVGETVRFYVAVNIPAYNNVDKLNLKVNDTLTNLEYKEGSVKVYSEEPKLEHSGDKITVSGATIDNAIKKQTIGDYTVNDKTGTQTLEFELDYDKIMGDSAQSKTVYIYYETTMREEAVTKDHHQGENIASLTYANAITPDSEHTTDKKDTDVYTYYLKLNKKKDDTDEALKGAEFSLYTSKTSKTPIEFVKVTDGDTVYYRPVVEGTEDDKANKVTKIEADFQIRGLDANTYYLEEVKTPNGYYAPAGRFEITLISKFNEAGNHSGKLDSASSAMTALDTKDANLIFGAKVDSDISHQFSAALKNYSTPNLPTTGGAGTMLLSIGGVALMAAGAYLIFFRKKEN